MTLNPKEVLKQTFGYEEFRQGQNEIISSIVNKKNVLAIMPTGAAQSLKVERNPWGTYLLCSFDCLSISCNIAILEICFFPMTLGNNNSTSQRYYYNYDYKKYYPPSVVITFFI